MSSFQSRRKRNVENVQHQLREGIEEYEENQHSIQNENEYENEYELNQNENQNIIQSDLGIYYLDNYIISNQKWFNSLVDRDIRNIIHIYNYIQILRIYQKICKNCLKLIELKKVSPINEQKKNFYEKYIYLYISQLRILNDIFKYKNIFEEFNQFNNLHINNLTIFNSIFQKNEDQWIHFQKRINNFIKKHFDEYNILKHQLQISKRYLDLRRLGLLQWICNSERSLIELIIHHESGRERNYNKNLENYVQNYINTNPNTNVKSVSNFLHIKQTNENQNNSKNRQRAEKVKFDNFNLFTEIKKKHLKTMPNQFSIVNNKPAFIQQLRNLDSLKLNWDEIIEYFGIRDLTFIQNKNSNSKITRGLEKLLHLFLRPIYEEKTKILHTSRDIIMMAISYILFNDDYKLEKKGNIIGKGMYGEVRLLNNKKTISRFENLRSTPVASGEERTIKAHYPAQSYVSCMNLISFIIQKFLYNLNNNCIPDIHNIKFNFQSNKSPYTKSEKLVLTGETVMNYTKIKKKYTNSTDLDGFIRSNIYYKSINFVPFIIKVIIRLCEILNFYQEKCMFVHRDLNLKNIMINFIFENDEINIHDFEVKIIDFGFSSIIINNMNNEPSQFTYLSYRSLKNPNISNPYFNKNWKEIDLRYFFIIFFSNFIKQNNFKNTNHIDKINLLNKIFINIFYEYKNENYINSYKRIKNELFLKKFSDIFFKINIRKEIFGNNFKEKYFNPLELKRKLQEII